MTMAIASAEGVKGMRGARRAFKCAAGGSGRQEQMGPRVGQDASRSGRFRGGAQWTVRPARFGARGCVRVRRRLLLVGVRLVVGGCVLCCCC